jgi:hypothetical protein
MTDFAIVRETVIKEFSQLLLVVKFLQAVDKGAHLFWYGRRDFAPTRKALFKDMMGRHGRILRRKEAGSMIL